MGRFGFWREVLAGEAVVGEGEGEGEGESDEEGDGRGEKKTVCEGGEGVVESLPSETGLRAGRVYWRIPELTRQGIFCAKVKTAIAALPETNSHSPCLREGVSRQQT